MRTSLILTLATAALSPSVVLGGGVHSVARYGSPAELRALLASDPSLVKFDDTLPGETPHTPLHAAISRNRIDNIRVLLEYEADPNAPSQWGTPIQMAVWNGHAEITQLLLARGGKVDVFV